MPNTALTASKTYHVFHIQLEIADAVAGIFVFTGWRHVADVQTASIGAEALEVAFRATNHIDSAWWDNAEVVWADPAHNMRSTSVGDVVLDAEGRAWEVASAGFRRFTLQSAPKLADVQTALVIA